MDTLALVVVLVVLVLLLGTSGLDYDVKRIWAFQRKRFQRSTQKRQASILKRLGRSEHFQVDLRQIRDLVISLQLGTSMDQTLSRSLTQAAEQFKKRGVFGERLQRQVETKLSIAPEEVLKGLADDFDSDNLRDLRDRLETARNGGMPYDKALSLTVQQLEEQIRGDLRREIQQTPIRLTFPMIGGVFLAALILAMFPLVMYLVQSSGVSGGF